MNKYATGKLCLGLMLAWLGSAELLCAQDPTAAQAQARAPKQLRTTDYLVPHISTVPANAGKHVELFVREKVQSKRGGQAPAVLMIHGATVSTVPVFDLQFENYSWMEYLANEGFDVFAMDFTGYGLSPRPMMDNPCNVTTAQQQQYLIPATLSQPCSPAYPYQLTTIKSDWDEIDRVVDYIRDLRGVDKVHIVAWSRGGTRAAGYAGLHSDKIHRLILYAPGDTGGSGNYRRDTVDEPLQPLPIAGAPMTILGKENFHATWDTMVSCKDQYSVGVRPVITQAMLDFDPLGSTWGTAGIRRAPNYSPTTPNWGLSTALVSKISVPTLFIRGDLDQQVVVSGVQALYEDVKGVPQKVWVHVACASHYLVWENQHMALLNASVEWLLQGTYAGQFNGSFAVDTAGQIHKEQ
jgi:pimeloyl-ACP methyl ester carboxylesterase